MCLCRMENLRIEDLLAGALNKPMMDFHDVLVLCVPLNVVEYRHFSAAQ
jgi:hypothetical protein